MKKKLLGYYDYTVILTYCGAVLALCGLSAVLRGSFTMAVIFLMLAGLCDMFDGAVAGTKERDESAKRFGIQIDSLCDLISFGVLPGVFTYCVTDCRPLAAVISVVFILCALIRLAYFNVLEEQRQQETDAHRTGYLGVPVTAIALALPAAYLPYFTGLFRSANVFPVLLTAAAVGFVSPVNVRKPQRLGKIIVLLIGAAELVGLLLIRKAGTP